MNIRKLHSLLIKNSVTRKYQYRMLSAMRRLVGVPDAFHDIKYWAQICEAQAILDVGCFVGDTIARFRDEIKLPIYGFEPTPESFNKAASRFENDDQVRLFNLALGDSNTVKEFFINKNPQTNSLLAVEDPNESRFSSGLKNIERVETSVRTLDSWASQFDIEQRVIIKADVQGAEQGLIRGGKSFFNNRVCAFYTEVQLVPMYKEQSTFFDINRILTSEHGFHLGNVYPAMHDHQGFVTQFDALWVKPHVYS